MGKGHILILYLNIRVRVFCIVRFFARMQVHEAMVSNSKIMSILCASNGYPHKYDGREEFGFYTGIIYKSHDTAIMCAHFR